MSAAKEELSAELAAAMHRIFDALRFMRGPTGELIYVGEKALHMAWHLARAGVDVDYQKAIIKARPVPDGIGRMSGMVDWVPIDWPDLPNVPPAPSALTDIDLEAFDDKLPWHVKTKIQGAFSE